MKGLSPLLASVLLIAVAVSMITIVGPWAYTFVRVDTEASGNQSDVIANCAVVEIDDVFLDTDADIGRAWIKALGETTITDADLLNKVGLSSNVTGSNTLPLLLGGGERKLIEFDISNSIDSCDNFSKVTIETNCYTDESTVANNC